jgi:hypothetical protein
MTSDRKQPGAAFWATVVVVVVLLGYPLSFGPACWITSHVHPGNDFINRVPWIGRFYWPILVLAWHVEAAWDFVMWYSTVGAKTGWTIAPQGNDRFAFVESGR